MLIRFILAKSKKNTPEKNSIKKETSGKITIIQKITRKKSKTKELLI